MIQNAKLGTFSIGQTGFLKDVPIVVDIDLYIYIDRVDA